MQAHPLGIPDKLLKHLHIYSLTNSSCTSLRVNIRMHGFILDMYIIYKYLFTYLEERILLKEGKRFPWGIRLFSKFGGSCFIPALHELGHTQP